MKPILFNTEMVRAVKSGCKTVTRRVVKPQPRGHAALLTDNLLPETAEAGDGAVYAFEDGTVTSPPYRPGDILYVRETWARYHDYYLFKAGCADTDFMLSQPGATVKWHPSIHMPKEAARLFLRVKDVRVERLQDCGNQQAKDEGCTCCAQFIRLWDRTIKPADLDRYGWVANPYVWVIEFERCERPGGGNNDD